MREDRSTTRMAAEFFGVVAIGGAVLFTVLFLFGQALQNRDGLLTGGFPISRDARAEIEQADCTRLVTLAVQYAPNADGVNPAFTAARLVKERFAELNCPDPPDPRPKWRSLADG